MSAPSANPATAIGACYILLDDETIHYRRVEYNVDATIEKIYAVEDLENFLGIVCARVLTQFIGSPRARRVLRESARRVRAVMGAANQFRTVCYDIHERPGRELRPIPRLRLCLRRRGITCCSFCRSSSSSPAIPGFATGSSRRRSLCLRKPGQVSRN